MIKVLILSATIGHPRKATYLITKTHVTIASGENRFKQISTYTQTKINLSQCKKIGMAHLII